MIADATAEILFGTGVANLTVGSNEIDIVVEAEDSSQKTYTVTITRAAASTNSNLASLAIVGETISPTFTPATATYTATVPFLTTDIVVTADTEDATATILSGLGSHALVVGANVIQVVVEAEDLSTTTYTINITREVAVTRTFRARTATDDSWYDVDSTLLGSGTHVDVFVEDGHGISMTTAQNIANEFDSNIYDLIHNNFAVESDVDGNGKVILLLLDIVDGYTGFGGYVAGYFDPTHMFSTATEPNSNQADMVFLDLNPAVPGSDEFYSTIAHEMQHLVNFSVTFLVDGSIQDTWINEGLSTGAEYLYAGGQIPSRIAYYNADPLSSIRFGNNFYIWNGFYELDPTGPQDLLANYSTVYLFFQWLRIHASNDSGVYSDILSSSYRDYRAVVDSTALRIDSSLDTWEEILGSWMQANLLSAGGGTGLNGYGGELTTTPWNFTPTSGASAALSSGEGVAIQTGTSPFAHPDGSGPNIRYRGVNLTFQSADTTGPLYFGDVLIVFNSSTLISPTDPVETAIVPSVASSSPELQLNLSTAGFALPNSYPVGVQFEPGSGGRRDLPNHGDPRAAGRYPGR